MRLGWHSDARASRWLRARAVLLGSMLPVVFAHAQVVPTPLAPATRPLVFRGVTVVDVRKGQRLPEQTVVIVGRRVTALGPVGWTRVPQGAKVVDARGQYMIPGLWDLHVHPMEYVDIAYPLFLANGITGIRDAGSSIPLATLAQWKREIVAGTRVGPRLLVSGPAIDQAPDSQTTVTYNYNLGYRHHILVPLALVGHVVDSLQAAGADMIKTYFVQSRDMYFAIAAAARRRGMLFGGHTYIPGLEASDSGATFLDHNTWFNPNVCDFIGSTEPGIPVAISLEACEAAARQLRRNNTWITAAAWFGFTARALDGARRYVPASFPNHPRTWVFSDSQVQAWAHEPTSTKAWAAVIARRRARGEPSPDFGFGSIADTGGDRRPLWIRARLPLVVGTDDAISAFRNEPGLPLHQTLLHLVTVGMTPLEALRAATLNPALALRASDSLGTVEVGKVADLVLLDADPLAEIMNTTKIGAVVANGRYYDREALGRLRSQAEQEAARR